MNRVQYVGGNVYRVESHAGRVWTVRRIGRTEYRIYLGTGTIAWGGPVESLTRAVQLCQ